MQREFERSGLIVFAISMLTNVFSLLFQISAGRALSVADYGTLNFLLSLILLLNVPSLALAQSVSRDVASSAAAGSHTLTSSVLKNAGVLAGIYSIALGTAAGLIVRLTGALAPHTFLPALLVGIAALTCFTAPLIGVAQGLQMPFAMAAGYLIIALFKFAGALLNGTLTGILLLNLAGCTAALGCLYILLKRQRREYHLIAVAAAARAKIDYRYLLSSCLLNFLFMYIQNCDVLLIQWFYADYTLGMYSPAMNFGRMVCYISSPVGVALFSFTLKEQERAGNSLVLYIKSIAFILGISLLFLLFIAVCGDRLLYWLYGGRYTASALYLVPAVLLGIGVSLCSLAMNRQLAVGRLKLLLGSFVGGSAVGSGISYVAADSQFLIAGLTAVFFLVFIVNFVSAVVRGKA
jgi:O-antigen/teichoic acid export membrane protein